MAAYSGDDSVVPLNERGEVVEDIGAEEWEVAGDDDGLRSTDMPKACQESTQWTGTRNVVGDEPPDRLGRQGRVTHDHDIVRERGYDVDRPCEKRSSIDQKGPLVAPHTAAFPASQDDAGEIRDGG